MTTPSPTPTVATPPPTPPAPASATAPAPPPPESAKPAAPVAAAKEPAAAPPAQDTKPTEPEGKDAPASGEADAVAFVPKLPEGVTLDAEALSALETHTKGMASEAKQALVDMHVAALTKAQEALAAQQETQRAEWATQLASDKELGGSNAEKTKAQVIQALKGFATKPLVDLLNETGLGDHPDVVRFFQRVGAAMADDRIAGTVSHPGSTNEDTEAARLARMYPSMQKQE